MLESHKGIQKGSGTVLLVDDEKFVANVGSEMLKSLGYKVLVARSGNEALEIFGKNQHEVDMVILDMVMLGMSGEETFFRLKEFKPSAKVLVSTGYSLEDEAGKLAKQGCDGFIQKPFNLQQLSEKVKEILSQT